MIRSFVRGASLLPLIALLGACVWQSDYDKLQAAHDAEVARNSSLTAQNQQLQGQNQQLMAQNQQLQGDVGRLTNAIKFTVNSDLLFKSGSYVMSPDGQEVIAKMASQLAPTQTRRLVVNGYTDNAPVGRGLQRQGITSNEMLSEKRAEAVRDYLISQGVKADLVTAKGWGETSPVASNDTPQGRAQNRRVELTLGQ